MFYNVPCKGPGITVILRYSSVEGCFHGAKGYELVCNLSVLFDPRLPRVPPCVLDYLP